MAIRAVTDAQWEKIRIHIPKHRAQPKGGRPWVDDRLCLEGILWVMSSGAQWAELPDRYPHYSTCWRRLKAWQQQGIFTKMWRGFLSDLNAADRINLEEAFADGTFAPAKKGGQKSARRRKARVRRSCS